MTQYGKSSIKKNNLCLSCIVFFSYSERQGMGSCRWHTEVVNQNYKFLMMASVKEEVLAVPLKSPVLFSGPEAMVFKTADSILSA